MRNLGFRPFLTLALKQAKRVFKLWKQMLLPPIITTSLYFVIFGQLLDIKTDNLQHFSYLQFIAPGLIMMVIINSAYLNTAFSFFSEKFQRSIEELLTAPLHPLALIFGFQMGSLLRALIAGAAVLLIAEQFAHMHVQHPWILLLCFLLTANLFSLLGFINAFYAKNFDALSVIPNFVLTPLIYLSGIFYSLSALPHFWQIISHVNPLTHLTNAFRYSMLGYSDLPITPTLEVIVGLNILALWAVWYMIRQPKYATL
jgi:ABC-2 type transport system permease protein